jgi:Ser-tRNA(Ala) deacylase AlaX
MGEALYLRDAYRREFDSVVVRSRPDALFLETTAFYPAGGGQPSDQGELASPDGGRWKVLRVEKGPEGIAHAVEGTPPPEGTRVHGAIDWKLRHAHMRYHTCLHILSGVVFHQFGSVITGNQIYPDKARMDLTLPDFSPEVAARIVDEVNAVARRGLPVTVRFLTKAQAEADPSLVRVARELMPQVDEVRLIDIEGFDVQADGGTHVANTRELGEVRLLKTENKGAKNKRIYVVLGEPPAPSS